MTANQHVAASIARRVRAFLDITVCVIESARPPSRHLTLKALVLVAAFSAWNSISDSIYEHLELDSVSRAHPMRIMMILVGTLVTCGGVVGLGCVLWAKQSLAGLGWRAPQPVRLVSLGLLLTALVLASVLGIVAALGGVPLLRDFISAVLDMPASERVFFVVMGAKVAFAEETLFRGLLQPSLASRLGAPAAIVLTSVVFGLYHRSLFPVPLLFAKIVLGLLFGVFALVSRSLLPAWMGHWLLWAIAGDR